MRVSASVPRGRSTLAAILAGLMLLVLLLSLVILMLGQAAIESRQLALYWAEKLVYVHENFYTLREVTTHEIGFYFLVDLNSEFPAPDTAGYIPSRESHIHMRLLPLAVRA